MSDSREKISQYIMKRAREARERLGLIIDVVPKPDDSLEGIIIDQEMGTWSMPYEVVIPVDKLKEASRGIKARRISPAPLYIAYFLAIVFAEALTTYVGSLWGFLFHFTILLLLIINRKIPGTVSYSLVTRVDVLVSEPEELILKNVATMPSPGLGGLRSTSSVG